MSDILQAAQAGDVAAVKALLARDPALVGVVDLNGKTPLHLAAEHDHPAVVDVLAGAGADLEVETTWGATPLQWAGVVGSRAAGEALLARGARLTFASAAGLGLLDAVARMPGDGAVGPAFVLACRNGHTAVARHLLERGADVNTRGFFGATALHWAALNGHADTIRFLLDAGADPALRDRQFDSDAHGWARQGGHDAAALLGST